MKKQIKVVMLPKILENGQERHLYITVSQDVEPIKEGDWKINEKLGTVWQHKREGKGIPENLKNAVSNGTRKIIATTDPKLYTNEIVEEDLHMYKKPLPQAPQSFIEEFVANPDGEFEIKYLTGHSEGRLKINKDNTVNITSVNKCLYDTPKSCENSECRVLNKCNGDRVTSVEEKMYSLEQMYLSAANVTHQIAANIGNSEWNMKVTPKMIVDNWIKENL